MRLDNVTHALIGVAIAKSVPAKSNIPQRAQVIASVLAANLPDADSLMGLLVGGGKLGYLLHHRGYTHTFLFVPIVAWISSFVTARLCRIGPGGSKGLLPVSLIAALSHIAADTMNNYGIHPFAPFWSRWFYGDMVFIIDPLLIWALIPLAWVALESRAARFFFLLSGLTLLGIAWFGPFLPSSVALTLTLWAALVFSVQWKYKTPAVAWLAVTLVIGVQSFAASFAKKASRVSAEAHFLGEREIDTILTAVPGTPACWRVIRLSRVGSDRWVTRIGGVSLWPDLFEPESCVGLFLSRPTTARLERIRIGDEHTIWLRSATGDVSTLRALTAKRCEVMAAMRFMRAPVLAGDGSPWVIGDHRYDREPELGFAEISWEDGKPEDCPSWVPDWEPPRADLLTLGEMPY